MILATCSYMLSPLEAVLRKRALPFCNHYRTKCIRWNPLGYGNKRGFTPADRLRAWLAPVYRSGTAGWTQTQ